MFVEVPFVPGSALAEAGILEVRITPPPPPPPGPWRLPGYGEPGALGNQVLPPLPPLALRVAPERPPERTNNSMVPPAPPPPAPSFRTFRALCPFEVIVQVPIPEPAWIMMIPPPAAPLLFIPAGLAFPGSAVPSLVVPAPPPPPIMMLLMEPGKGAPPKPLPSDAVFQA